MNCLVRAVFLDRDGVINRPASRDSYITLAAEFEPLPNSLLAIAELTRAGYLLLIITNQRGIARGIIKSADLEEIHAKLLRAVERWGGRIAKIYVCPHDYSDECNCRKPKPGMLLQAQIEHQIALSASWVVGDSESDILAGKQVGCKTAFIGDVVSGLAVDICAKSLEEAAQAIIQYDNPSSSKAEPHKPMVFV